MLDMSDGVSGVSKRTTGIPWATSSWAASSSESAGVSRTPRTACRAIVRSSWASSATEAWVEDRVMTKPASRRQRSMPEAASMKNGLLRSKTATATRGEVPRLRAWAVGLGT